MKRALIIIAVTLFVAGGAVSLAGAGKDSSGAEYHIVFDNAFGLVKGADFKVGGVAVGSITDLDVTPDARAKVTVQATESGDGFAGLRQTSTCTVNPQSLIGEYFVDCQPGRRGDVLEDGATIPVQRTSSPIPPDLVLNIMRKPVAERFSIILSELGIGFAARGNDVNETIRRAVPAFKATDDVLKQLAANSDMLADLSRESGQVLKVLGDRGEDVGDFVLAARDAASASAERRDDIAETFRRFPGFLDELTPTMTDLGITSRQLTPALADLRAAAPAVDDLLTTLQPFSRASVDALETLGDAGKSGRTAAREASSLVQGLADLGDVSAEPAKNLDIILDHLDNRDFAVEADPDSPTGKGYTGLEAPLQYMFDQTLALNTFDQRGYSLKINLTADQCSGYMTAEAALAGDGKYGNCNQNLGPNQPGITTPDPSGGGRFVLDPQTSKAGAKPKAELPDSAQDQAGAPGPAMPAPGDVPTPAKKPVEALVPIKDIIDNLPQLLDPVTGQIKPLLGGDAPDQSLLDYLLKP